VEKEHKPFYHPPPQHPQLQPIAPTKVNTPSTETNEPPYQPHAHLPDCTLACIEHSSMNQYAHNLSVLPSRQVQPKDEQDVKHLQHCLHLALLFLQLGLIKVDSECPSTPIHTCQPTLPGPSVGLLLPITQSVNPAHPNSAKAQEPSSKAIHSAVCTSALQYLSGSHSSGHPKVLQPTHLAVSCSTLPCIGLYMYHKYQKALHLPVLLNAHGHQEEPLPRGFYRLQCDSNFPLRSALLMLT
jgi:hypothetical protein